MVGVVVVWALVAALPAEAAPVPAASPRPLALVNGDFRQPPNSNGVPSGWSRYGKRSDSATVGAGPSSQGFVLDDQDPAAETGLTQTFDAEPNIAYEVTVRVRSFTNRGTEGAYVQLRFLPSDHYVQTDLAADSADAFADVVLTGLVPAGPAAPSHERAVSLVQREQAGRVRREDAM